MLTFLLGVACGAVLLFVFFVWWGGRQQLGWSVLRARQELGDLERQTVQQLFATEMAARRAAPRAAGTDVIDGSATDLGRSA